MGQETKRQKDLDKIHEYTGQYYDRNDLGSMGCGFCVLSCHEMPLWSLMKCNMGIQIQGGIRLIGPGSAIDEPMYLVPIQEIGESNLRVEVVRSEDI